MGHFLVVLRRFQRDDRGAFAVIFAVLAIVLVAMSGAVVDFTSVQQARTRAQVALDASALALEPTIYTSTASQIQTQAQALLVDRLADAATSWGNCATNSYKAPCATVALPVVDTTNGQLTLNATIKVQMNFVDLVGVQTISSQIVSVATRKKLSLEVAMALDNSGSMGTVMSNGSTRIVNLQASANCASNILFYGVTTCAASTTGLTKNANVKIGLVPFTSAVNVGTANASATWIDRSGNNNISDNNFDTNDNDADTFTGPVDRIALFGQMSYSGTALSWGGCVEARYNNGSDKQYDTDDTTPDPTQPATLFTPYFAPDEPGNPNYAGSSVTVGSDTFFNSYISDDTVAACHPVIGNCTIVGTTPGSSTLVATTVSKATTVTKKNKNTGAITSGPTTTTAVTNSSTTTVTSPVPATTTVTTLVTPAGVTSTGPAVCSCANDTTTTTNSTVNGTTTTKVTVTGPSTSSSTSGTTTTTTSITTTTTTNTTPQSAVSSAACTQHYYASGLDNRELQERLCKYNGAVLAHAPSQGNVYGPNGDCPLNPITPLTNTPATITAAVNAMSPQGATNIAEGAAWAFRVLSPTAPFTEGAAYNSTTSKVMIIMTDGENTRYPYANMNDAQYYSPYGYPWNTNGRLGTATTDAHTLEQRVNARLATTCTNAKAAGITVYTIGLATSATDYPSENTTLLTNCATESDYAFFPTSASDLQTAFTTIANQLAALRLSK